MIKQQFIAFYTIVRREIVRMLRIISQVFLPPVITTALYFLIFSTVIGKRIGMIDTLPYGLFIAPGLIMMTLITNAYGNVSSSLFGARFQRNIEEILVSPINNVLLLLSYITGGILRGFIVALLVYLVARCFVDFPVQSWGLTLLVILLVSTIFSLAGFTNAMIARNFDDIMLIPTFILTPLTYLGGVFYSTSMLSPFWSKIAHFNPILYMVNALRHAMIGHQEVNFQVSMLVIVAFVILLLALNLILLRKGVGLRE